MRAKRLTLSAALVVGILLVLTSSLSYAQEAIFETFDDPELPGWERTENAVVQDGYLEIAGTGFAFRPDLKMSGAFSLRLSLEGGGTTEIRYQISEIGAYILSLHVDQVQLIREEAGTQIVLSSSDRGIQPREWVFIEFNPTPEGQVVFIDQGIELQTEEASALPSGSLMLQVLGEVTARFDDLSLALQTPDANTEEEGTTEPPAEGETTAPSEASPGTGQPAYENTEWVHLGGPPGGLGYDIRIDDTDPDVMYVTDANSGIHKSTDGGLSWFNVSQDIIHIHDSALIFCATIDPFDHNSIWIGTQYTGHLYLSTDGGTTWEVREEGIRSDDDPRSLRGITIDPNDQNTVYIGLEVNEESPRIASGEVYRSTDRGMHWDLIWEGENLARYVWIDPRDSDIIYISTGIFDRDARDADPENRDFGGVGVVRSRDGGETWEELGKNHGLNALYIPSLMMHPTDPDTLVAAGFDKVPQETGTKDLGVYVTHDGGDTWEQVLQEIVHAVEISTLDPDVWYAASEFRIWRSEDAGQSWVSYPINIGQREVGLPIDMQVDPRDKYRIFINNYGGGNFLSEDGGETWVDASQGYTGANIGNLRVSPHDSARVFANSNSGPYESLDGGVTWIGLLPTAGGKVFIPTENSFLMWHADSMGNIWRSTDEGQTWASAQMIDLRAEYLAGRLPNPEYPINALAAAPSDPQILYAGLADGYCLGGNGDAVSISISPGYSIPPMAAKPGRARQMGRGRAAWSCCRCTRKTASLCSLRQAPGCTAVRMEVTAGLPFQASKRNSWLFRMRTRTWRTTQRS